MNNKYKVLILSLVFILPVAVFLFLKFFGKNQFELTMLSDAATIENCDDELKAVLTDQIDIVLVRREECKEDRCNFEKDEFRRIRQRYEDKELRFSILSRDTIDISWNDNSLSAYTTESTLGLSCFERPDSESLFLVFDGSNNLRGVYEVSREETDRLILEIDILMRYE